MPPHDMAWTLATDPNAEAPAHRVAAPCPGCGGRHADRNVARHEYLTTSRGCWARFCEMLAWQYSDHRYWRMHDLMVDAYCLQHASSGDPRAVAAVPVHLAGLHAQFTLRPTDLDLAKLRKALSRRGFRRPLVPWPRPTAAFDGRIEDPDRHEASIQRYARSVWSDWRDHHDLATALCRLAMSSIR